ncbi:MAG: hypothetical protein DMF19_00405 [Verrucomicrobia bacterium]|nr:MAG: hypothetical protein DMF19_00405 [Verrucomicrobiota bacterium]
MKAVIQLMFRLTFGILAVGFGLAIICWICYNQFVERLPQSHGFHWWEPLGIGPVLIATGLYWLRRVRTRG